MARAPGGSFAATQRGVGGVTNLAVLTGWFELLVITVMMIAYVVHVSAILDLFVGSSTRIALAVQYATFLIYAYVALMQGHVRIVAVGAGLVVYLIAMAGYFSLLSGAAMNVNATLSFGTLLMAVVLYETRLPLGTILLTLLSVCTGYLVLYLILTPTVLGHQLNGSRLILLSDGTRPNRVFLAGQLSSYVLFAGLLQLRSRPIIALPLVVLALAAIYLSQSRAYQAALIFMFLIVMLGAAWPMTRRPVSIALAAVFLVLAGISVYGFFDPGFNFYQHLNGDSSGMARYVEYEDARRALGSNYLTGVGVEPSPQALEAFVRPKVPFFPSDLGTAGVFFQFGIIGLVLFVAGSVACILAIPSASVRRTPLSLAFHYTTLQAAIGGFFSAVLWGSNGAIFAALTLALWLKGGYFRAQRTSAARRYDEIDPTAFGIDTRVAEARARNEQPRRPLRFN